MAANDPNQWESDPENIEVMKLLIERTKDVKSPLNTDELAEEYQGVHLSDSSFKRRVRFLSGKVAKMESIDNVTKVKMMFALSVRMNRFFFKELKKDAYVKLDKQSRLIKYRSNDGSLDLEGEHQSKRARMKNLEFDGSRNSESTKRAAVEVPDNSTKRPRIDTREQPGAQHPSSGDSGSFEHLDQESEDYASLESQPLSGSMDILNHPGIRMLQEPRIQEFREPKQESESLEAPEAAEGPIVQMEHTTDAPGAPGAQESPNPRIGGTPVAPEPSGSPAPASELSRANTPQTRFLGAIQSLVITLDTPTLSPLQAKVEKKLRESASNQKIPNDEIIPAMELLVARITNNSVPGLPETVESVSLSHFLCYLKAAILTSKLEGLEVVLGMVKERIKEPALKDKSIPVEKVARALQDTLNNVGF